MEESFYQDSILLLKGALKEMYTRIDTIREYELLHNDRDPIEYVKGRIKTEESIKEKLKRKNLPVNLETALTKIYDAVGLRIVCSYIDDVYKMAEILKKYKDLKVIKEKDYIKNPKPNRV